MCTTQYLAVMAYESADMFSLAEFNIEHIPNFSVM